MTKMFHLAYFSMAGHAGESDTWQLSTDGYDWRHPEIYQDIARACERAKFDMVFFADTLAMPQVYKEGWDYYVKAGLWTPSHDPIPVMGLIAAATSKIGIVSTISTSFYPPFMAARALATLDHLSRGRMGWNVVTSLQKNAAQNMGLEDLLMHDLRYEVADEYIDLCHQLWKSWEPGALVLDRETGVFADPSKVHLVDFEGKYFKSRGPLTVSSSPQGHPVIISAGSSPRGMKFAAQHTELTIAHKTNVPAMKAFTSKLRSEMDAMGRDPRSCKIFNLMNVVVGETDSIAQEKLEAHVASKRIETALATMSEALGLDISPLNLDEPLPATLLENSNGQPSMFQGYYENDNNPTLREVANHYMRNAAFTVVGTPEHICDILEEASREGDMDGFLLDLAIEDYHSLIEFIDKVVPLAQRRGLLRKEYSGKMFRDHLAEF